MAFLRIMPIHEFYVTPTAHGKPNPTASLPYPSCLHVVIAHAPFGLAEIRSSSRTGYSKGMTFGVSFFNVLAYLKITFAIFIFLLQLGLMMNDTVYNTPNETSIDCRGNPSKVSMRNHTYLGSHLALSLFVASVKSNRGKFDNGVACQKNLLILIRYPLIGNRHKWHKVC